MSVSLEQFSSLVSGVYGAALDVSRREAALRAVVDALGGSGGALLLAEPQARRFSNTAFGIDVSEVARYDAHYGRLDPVAPVLERAPAGSVFASHEAVGHEALRRSEFYNDWAQRIGSGDGIAASLLGGGRCLAWFVCSAPLRAERFGTSERMRLMRLLVPHLRQALRTELDLREAVGAADAAFDAFGHVRNGVVRVTAGGKVARMNAAAAELFRTGQGLSLQADGCLRAALPKEDAALQRAIGLAARGDGDGVRAGASVTASRPSGGWPLVVHVLPVQRGLHDLDQGEAMALLVIVDVGRRSEPRPEFLRQLFGLTRAEAMIAVATLRCETLQEVAGELSVSLSTVRTHLQRVYEKTGVHRRADLAHLVATIESGFVEPASGHDRNQ